ncbi:MAG TPA: RidA family protein, partial [Vicinamibacterales bacterium]|nr:RidA family protein [Vicinamibacterales bacterium]
MTLKLAALAAAAAASMPTCSSAGPLAPIAQASARPPARAAFAPAASRGGLVYVSAILPPDSSAAFETQATGVFEELKARLDGAGTTIDRVVSATVVLADAGDFPALNAAWNAVWPASRPTRTTIVGRLPVAGARLQVSAIAASAGTSREIVVPPGWQASALPYSP